MERLPELGNTCTQPVRLTAPFALVTCTVASSHNERLAVSYWSPYQSAVQAWGHIVLPHVIPAALQLAIKGSIRHLYG